MALFAHASVWDDIQDSLKDCDFGEGETNWVDGDLVVTYTNATDVFYVPGVATVDILEVGGGGGGGRVCITNDYGGGGGGGGGGVVTNKGLLKLKGRYTITVGRGGAAAEYVKDGCAEGGDGGNTFITKDGSNVVEVAIGGGGGGAASAGHNGGCGGGGSKNASETAADAKLNGGSPVAGQGYAGGYGHVYWQGGAGGGAGAKGKDTARPGTSTYGGDGRTNEITGVSVYYGGGGGGGNTMGSNMSKGGAGGGGKGGGGRADDDAYPATDGIDGLGGGGGGGGSRVSATAGRGGCGVLIIRITSYVPGGVPIPQSVTFVYDGTEKVACTERSEYRFLDTNNTATVAGEYEYTIELVDKNRYKWEDDTIENKTIKWTITKLPVSKPKAVEGLVYNSEEQCGSNPESHDRYTLVGHKEKNAGTYTFTATLTNSANTMWEDGKITPVNVSWRIAQATNKISSLTIDDYLLGTRVPVPKIVAASGEEVTAEYKYGDSETGPFKSSEVPTTPGYHWVRAALDETINWSGVAATNRFNVWRHPQEDFTDYVDITNTFTSGQNVISFTIAESDTAENNGLPGFSHVRAGSGDKIRFVMRGGEGDGAKDQFLFYEPVEWNQGESSTFKVQVPANTSGTVVIRMYWHLKDGVSEIGSIYDDTAVTGVANEAKPSFGLVNREGTWINYWVTAPAWKGESGTTKKWDTDSVPDPVSSEFNEYALKVGSVSSICCIQPYELPVEGLPRTNGIYDITFDMADKEGYEIAGGSKSLSYEVLGHTSDGGVGDSVNGRILLGNNDTNATLGVITGQAYWQKSADLGDATYWKHGSEKAKPAPRIYPVLNKQKEYRHELISTVDGRVLWRLEHVLLGNLYASSGKKQSEKVYLPYSLTSEANTSKSTKFSASEAGHLVMRSTKDACVYSPCYTNGIGTIYFDAVNGLTDGADQEYYKVAVDIATNVYNSTEVPTDENMVSGTGWDETMGDWKRINNLVVLKTENGGKFTKVAEGDEVVLNVTAGGSDENFFRIYASVNYKGPIRFRIRRTTADSKNIDSKFILLDNIIASEVPKVVNLTTPEEGALSVQYPSMTDTGIHGRAKLVEKDVKNEWVSSAKFLYRWRYLNQQIDDWKSLYLGTPNASGVFETVKPLVLDGRQGDIEYKYELTLMAPYYQYQDYSGAEIVPATGDYTEEKRSVTNSLKSATTLGSLGTDWFVRLREGKSDWEKVQLRIKVGDNEYIPKNYGDMILSDDHTWRGFLLTTNMPSTIQYQIEASKPGATNIYYSTVGIEKFPASGRLIGGGSTNDWGSVPCDNSTGYLMFQFNDENLDYTIVHADYQNFNNWHDAHNDYFAGASTEEPSSGVSPLVQEFQVKYADRKATPDTDEYGAWRVSFSNKLDTAGYDGYTPFTADEGKSYNGWRLGAGQYVYGNYRDPASYMAYQMAGRGMGYIELTEARPQPRGLGSISFQARLAQDIDPEAFSRLEGGWENAGAVHFAPSLTDYSVFTRVAFDQNGNTNFAGNASLSLMAYYRGGSGGGCYEARWEQLYADTNNSGRVKGPLLNGQRLAIYRWKAQPSGLFKATELFAVTNGVSKTTDGKTVWSFIPPLLGQNDLTNSTAKGLMPFFISVYEDNTNTCVLAGVRSRGISYHEGDSASEFNGDGWMCAAYRDGSSDRLKSGSYGVLSANCEGVFVRPAYYDKKIDIDSTITGESGSVVDNQLRGLRQVYSVNIAMIKINGLYRPSRKFPIGSKRIRRIMLTVMALRRIQL